MRIKKIYSPTDILNEILNEIESGNKLNDFGERMTEYHSLVVAKCDGFNDFVYLSVSVTEETHDVDIPWYSIHVVDDINDEDCYIAVTNTLRKDELLEKLVEIVHATIEKNSRTAGIQNR